MKNKTDEELCRLIKDEDNLEARNELWTRYWDTIQKFVTPDHDIKDPGWDESKALEWLLLATVDAAKKYDPKKNKPFKHLLLCCLRRSKFFFKMSSTRTPRASHPHVRLGVSNNEDDESGTEEVLGSIVNSVDSEDKFRTLVTNFLENGDLSDDEKKVFQLMTEYNIRSVRLVSEGLNKGREEEMTSYQVRKIIGSVRRKLVEFLECQKIEESCWCS